MDKTYHLRDLTLENIDILISFYKTHSTAATSRYFHCHKDILIKYLQEHDIEVHSSTVDNDLIKQQRIQTNIRKYGCKSPSQSKDIREKIHIAHISKSLEEKAEIQAKRETTNLARFGVKNVGQFGTNEYKAAIKEKYGTEYASQADCIKEKIKQTCLEKYGVNSYLQTQECRIACVDYFEQNHDDLVNKRGQTNLERYGSEIYTKTDEFKNKSKQTCLEKYGVELAVKSEEVKEKIKQTNLEKYGVENISQADEIKEKKKQTAINNFGVEHPTQSEEVKTKIRDA